MTHYDPFKVIPAVLVAVMKGDEVLLAKRHNTSYMDGWYGLPGGHLEASETVQSGASREVAEEVNIKVEPADLELFQIYQNDQPNTKRQYIGFLFRATKWTGDPAAMEEKVKDVEFFPLDNLPENLIPYHREALQNIYGPSIKTIFTTLYGADKR